MRVKLAKSKNVPAIALERVGVSRSMEAIECGFELCVTIHSRSMHCRRCHGSGINGCGLEQKLKSGDSTV